MNTLLFIHGPEGLQMGVEDGFMHLEKTKKINKLKWFYYREYAKKNKKCDIQKKMFEVAKSFQPQLIVFFHILDLPVNDKFFLSFKNLESKPTIVYHEEDMYGGWSKPMTKSMKIAFKNADIVSISGLGKWYKNALKYNKTVIYTTHSNRLFRYSQKIELAKERSKDILFIGNRVRSRLGNIRRLHGAKNKEKIVSEVGKHFKTEFALFGKGWDNFPGNKGALNFHKQANVCPEYWFHLSYEHYPEIPYYFSTRLPIALSLGQIYICHLHEGYKDMFKNTDFIYFYKNEDEAIDILNYLKTLSNEQLYQKSVNAKKWANENLSPLVVWGNFYERIKSISNR